MRGRDAAGDMAARADDYGAYRRTAKLIFKDYGWKVDFDHALSRNLARLPGYSYVLLTRANPRVN